MSRNHADVLFSLLVRARDGRCAACGTRGRPNSAGLPVIGLECAHIIGRRYSATRVDPDNALALCGLCHRHYTDHPFAWENFVIKLRGRDEWDRLVAKSHDPLAKIDWAEETKRLRDELRPLLAAA